MDAIRKRFSLGETESHVNDRKKAAGSRFQLREKQYRDLYNQLTQSALKVFVIKKYIQ